MHDDFVFLDLFLSGWRFFFDVPVQRQELEGGKINIAQGMNFVVDNFTDFAEGLNKCCANLSDEGIFPK